MWPVRSNGFLETSARTYFDRNPWELAGLALIGNHDWEVIGSLDWNVGLDILYLEEIDILYWVASGRTHDHFYGHSTGDGRSSFHLAADVDHNPLVDRGNGRSCADRYDLHIHAPCLLVFFDQP